MGLYTVHCGLWTLFPLASEKGQVGIFRLFFRPPLSASGWPFFLLFGLRPTRCSLAAARHSNEFYTKNGVWWGFPTALKLVCMNISFISNYNETVFRNVLAIALANPRGVHRLMVRRASGLALRTATSSCISTNPDECVTHPTKSW